MFREFHVEDFMGVEFSMQIGVLHVDLSNHGARDSCCTQKCAKGCRADNSSIGVKEIDSVDFPIASNDKASLVPDDFAIGIAFLDQNPDDLQDIDSGRCNDWCP